MLLLAAKTMLFFGVMFPIAFSALSTGILFASYNIAVARNPDEVENIFNTTLMGFALIETFVFLSLIISVVGYFI